MALEPKEILEYLGVDATVEDLEAFKESFNTTFIKKDQVGGDDEIVRGIWGKKTGILQKAMAQMAKTLGIELPDPTFKTIKHEEQLIKMAETINATFDEERQTLAAQKGDGGKVAEELEKKYKKLEKALQEKEVLLQNVTSEYDTYKEGHVKEKRGSLVKNHFSEAKSKVKIIKDVPPLLLKGWEAEFNEEYELQADDEKGEVYPVLKSNGQRVKSAKKASEYATTAEILEQKAIQHKIYDMTPEQKGKTAVKTSAAFSTNTKDDNVVERPIHPNALKAEEQERG